MQQLAYNSFESVKRKSAPKEVPFKGYIYMTATKERCRFWEYITAYQNNKGDILNGSQKVIGEFICDRVICCQAYYGNSGEKHLTNLFGNEVKQTCLTEEELFNYIVGNKKEGTGWLWHVSDLKIYDKPRELKEFGNYKKCVDIIDKGQEVIIENYSEFIPLTRPPQSWQYVEGLQ